MSSEARQRAIEAEHAEMRTMIEILLRALVAALAAPAPSAMFIATTERSARILLGQIAERIVREEDP